MSEGICGVPSSCIGYSDFGRGGGVPDYFTYPAGRAGVTYYIVVDSSQSANSGSFTLTVH